MQNAHYWLVENGVTFTQMRHDEAACAPGRAAHHTGMSRFSHGITGGNTSQDYYAYYRLGKRRPGSSEAGNEQDQRWAGPWEIDLAARAGLPQTSVSSFDQIVNTLKQIHSGDMGSDDQDSLHQWMASAYNMSASAAAALSETQLQTTYVWADDASAPYIFRRTITTLTNAVSAGIRYATATTSGAHSLVVGQRVYVTGVSQNAYNKPYESTIDTGGAIIVETPTASSFKYVISGNPGGNGSAASGQTMRASLAGVLTAPGIVGGFGGYTGYGTIRKYANTANKPTAIPRLASGPYNSFFPTNSSNAWDDLQAYSGSLANFLSQNGVRCGLMGKYQNGYADEASAVFGQNNSTNTYRYVPPGWSFWTGEAGMDNDSAPNVTWAPGATGIGGTIIDYPNTQHNGGAQDHWRVHTCEFNDRANDGENPGDGLGATGRHVAYRYDIPISSISYSNGLVTVIADPSYGRPHNLEVGDELHIDGVTTTNPSTTRYNTIDGHAGFTCSEIVDEYTCRFYLGAEISSITWANSAATVTTNGYHHQVVGDRVFITGISPSSSGYAMPFASGGFLVSSIPSGIAGETQFVFTLNSNPGGSASAASGETMRCHRASPHATVSASGVAIGTGSKAGSGGGSTKTVYPRPNYGDAIWRRSAIEFLDSCYDDEPWLLYVSVSNPHGGTTPSNTASDVHERERRYMGTVAPSAFAGWNGVAGAYSPQVNPTDVNVLNPAVSATSYERMTQWAQRQEMLASTDDLLGELITLSRERGWDNVIVIMSSDNGYQMGDKGGFIAPPAVSGYSSPNRTEESNDVWATLGAKGYIWEGSLRIPLHVHHPLWARGTICTLPCTPADLLPTLLDVYGITDHHAHDKRDGYSLIRLLEDPTNSIANRKSLIVNGSWNGDQAEGFVDNSQRKFIRKKFDHNTYRVYDVTTRFARNADGLYAITDYEQTDLSGTSASGDITAYNAALDELRMARWYPDLNVNTLRSNLQ